MGGGASPGGGITSFDATATVQTETVQSPQQTITTDVIYYYHNDHLGTPMFLSDESGKEVWRREQTPFGEETFQRGSVTENLRFPGQYWDAEKGSSYNLYRDNYDPKLGRYGQPDPIGQAGGVNVYPYAKDNPVNLVDPTGEIVIVLVIPAIAAGEALLEAAAATAVVTAGIAIYEKEGDFDLNKWLDRYLTKQEKKRKCLPAEPRNKKKCEEQYGNDCGVCRKLRKPAAVRARCWASATARYGNCLANKPLGPLVTL